MLHPDTRIQYINDDIGYGIFATKLIPKGTAVYTKEKLEIELKERDIDAYDSLLQSQISKYTYNDENGKYILSWDLAKYVNHCCEANTLSTAYGFDIAINDIQKGEEITCDYAMLNIKEDMTLQCSRPECRNVLRPLDFEYYYRTWDEKVKKVLHHFFDIEQALLPLIDSVKIDELMNYIKNPKNYQSVYNLRYPNLISKPSI